MTFVQILNLGMTVNNLTPKAYACMKSFKVILPGISGTHSRACQTRKKDQNQPIYLSKLLLRFTSQVIGSHQLAQTAGYLMISI
uniref:Uncharacterized protein n=1 Tax=Rhizophora mucronata TaxID=61149 RepID=A0A2P2KX24_RHIMU